MKIKKNSYNLQKHWESFFIWKCLLITYAYGKIYFAYMFLKEKDEDSYLLRTDETAMSVMSRKQMNVYFGCIHNIRSKVGKHGTVIGL